MEEMIARRQGLLQLDIIRSRRFTYPQFMHNMHNSGSWIRFNAKCVPDR